jgi:RES domain-containing protein
MAAQYRARDNGLIDAIEAIPSQQYAGAVWRGVRDGRDALTSSAVGGRWDDGTFDVLYTSEQADGAASELHFHLSRGQQVMPSKDRNRLYELQVKLNRALRLADISAISRLGVNAASYGALSYQDRHQEYPRTQEIAETAHFIGFDGLCVPSARWKCMNVVLFTARVPPDQYEIAKDHGLIDWHEWTKSPFGY